MIRAPEDWSEVRLEEVASDITVGYVGTMANEYVESGVPFLRSLNVEPYIVRLDSLKYISNEFHQQLSKSRLCPGDLIVVRTGKPGTAAVIPQSLGECNCSDLVIIRPSEQLDSSFLAYVFNSGWGQTAVDGRLVGSVQKHFNIGDAKRLRVKLPPLAEQREIAGILGALDDKIALNRQMNATLEAIARALFQSWFVDFDPVRAKAEGRAPDGLAAETAALFPASFDDSALGPVPSGWRVSTIGEEVRVVGGSTPSTKEPAFWDDGEYAWATPKDLSYLSTPVLLSTSRQITELGLGQISSGLLPVGTVLLSSRAPVGYLAIAEIPVAINQGFIAMNCDQVLSNYYVLWWATLNMDAIKAKANGTTFQEVSKSSFRPIPVLVPTDNVIRAFDEIVGPLYRQIVRNEHESRTLAETRDALLPKLVSGELRVGTLP